MATKSQVEKSQIDKPVVNTNIGNCLKARRVEINLDEKQVANKLRIPIDQVRALESNNFGYFRSSIFARGYLKAYCQFVDIDIEEILEAYDELQSDVVSSLKTVDKVISKQTKFSDPIVVLVLVVLIAVIIFLGFWWPFFPSKNFAVIGKKPFGHNVTIKTSFLNQTSVLDSINTENVDVDNATKINGIDEPKSVSVNKSRNLTVPIEASIASKMIKDDGVTTGMSAETVALLEESGVDAKKVERQTKKLAMNSQVASARNTFNSDQLQASVYKDDIEATFEADCWVEIRDSTGKILYSGVESDGSELNLTGKPPYQVVLGYTKGITYFKYKGEQFDFSSYTLKDLARFELE